MIHADRFRIRHHEVVGACHRCGWTGPVLKLRHHDRKVLGTGRDYARLCRDCTEDLYQARTGGHGTAARTPLRALQDRDVA